MSTCTYCKGTGQVEVVYADGGHGEVFLEPCKACKKAKPKLRIVK
jgi:DnaJ-class molecular chaperone